MRSLALFAPLLLLLQAGPPPTNTYPPSQLRAIGVTPPPAPVKPGQLVAFWRWEDSLTDEIGPFTCVFQTGSASYTAGMDGRALVVDSSNTQCKLLKTPAQLGDTTDDFSVAWWVYRGTLDINTNIDRVTEPFSAYDWSLWHSGVLNTCTFSVYGVSGGKYSAVGPEATGNDTWNFIAGTWDDSAEDGMLYTGYDGAALVETAAVETLSWTGPRRRTSGALRIAVFQVNPARADELRYWKVPLKRQDIDKLYAAGPP
jgi:hypothetical protein